MKFDDIPQLTQASYSVHVSWAFLEKHLDHEMNAECGAPLILEPDFQRAHVWSLAQQTAYVEWVLKGGKSGLELLLNCPEWQKDFRGPYELVDGLQRLTAVRKFLKDEVKAFGFTCTEMGGVRNLHHLKARFIWSVANLENRSDVLKWYLQINSGGVVHTDEELDWVRKLLEKENGK